MSYRYKKDKTYLCKNNKIESAIRNLRSLKVDIGQCRPVLISIIMNKLPAEIKLQISLIMPATEEWDVTNLLEVLLQEINPRELCSYMSHTNFKQNLSRSDKYGNDNRQSNYTAFAMYSGYSRASGSSNHTCTFCKQNHSSAKCNIITNPTSRKAILRSKAKCFVCLRSGHKANECRSNYILQM